MLLMPILCLQVKVIMLTMKNRGGGGGGADLHRHLLTLLRFLWLPHQAVKDATIMKTFVSNSMPT